MKTPDKSATQIKKEIAFNKISNFFGDIILAINKHKTADTAGWLIPIGRILDVTKCNQAEWFRPAVITDLVPASEANSRKLGVGFRPVNEECFLLLDDVTAADVEKKHKGKPGRMIIETSPGNYHVWIKSDRELSNDEKIYWMTKLHADTGATPVHRHGRMPGFIQRKPRPEQDGIAKDFFIRITYTSEGTATFPILEEQELRRLVPRPEAPTTLPVLHTTKPVKLPERDKFFHGDESAADYGYAMALAWRGLEDFEIAHHVQRNRPDWSKYPGRQMEIYINNTVKRAKAQVDRVKV